MKEHSAACVDRYTELTGKPIASLKQPATPCIDDHDLSLEDFEVRGTLARVAARIVLKVLYTAR